MQPLSKIQVLTVDNFNNFEKGDLFRLKNPEISPFITKNSETICSFIEYFEIDDHIYIKALCYGPLIENIIDKADFGEDFLNTYVWYISVFENEIVVF